MKKIFLLFSILISFFSTQSFAQTDENNNDIWNQYIVLVEAPVPARVTISRIKRDLDEVGYSYFGLDSKDAMSIDRINHINRVEIERKALKPFFDEICSELETENADIEYIAEMFLESKVAEEEAVKEALYSISDNLSPEGTIAFDRLISDRINMVTIKELDWLNLASDHPEAVFNVFIRACDNFLNPGNHVEKSSKIGIESFSGGTSINSSN